MGIRRAFSVGDGFVAPETPEGGLYALIDGNGEYYSAGFEGPSQKHPLPVTGAQRIFLGTGGPPSDASVGYNVITGSGVTQTAAGLVGTVSSGVPEVIIDFPFMGSPVFSEVTIELACVCASPGSGTFIGPQIDSNSSSGQYGFYLSSNGTNWAAEVERTGVAGARGTTTIAFGALSTVDYISGQTRVVSPTVRAGSMMIGEDYTLLGLSSSAGQSITMEDISIPTTWGVRVRIFYGGSGSDLAYTIKSIAFSEPQVLTTEP